MRVCLCERGRDRDRKTYVQSLIYFSKVNQRKARNQECHADFSHGCQVPWVTGSFCAALPGALAGSRKKSGTATTQTGGQHSTQQALKPAV